MNEKELSEFVKKIQESGKRVVAIGRLMYCDTHGVQEHYIFPTGWKCWECLEEAAK